MLMNRFMNRSRSGFLIAMTLGMLTLGGALGGCSLLGIEDSKPASDTTSTGRGAAQTPPDAQAELQPPLKAKVYRPDDSAVFSVASTLIEGRQEAILIDAQFSREDARELVERIRQSGKRLSTIYISHSDPDYYLGLETLKAAFPQARIVATAPTVAAIRASGLTQLEVWAPQLGEDAPSEVIVPEVLDGDRLVLEHQSLRIMGLDGPTPDRTFVWIPSIRTVVGGVSVFAGEHVWMADAQTPQARADWLQTLADIEALQPDIVIPGHYARGGALDVGAVRFTADYIRAFETENARTRNAAALVRAMQARYPDLRGNGSLEISARVAKGEMDWP